MFEEFCRVFKDVEGVVHFSSDLGDSDD